MGGAGSSWPKYPFPAMCSDFHSEDAVRAAETASFGSPLSARYRLIRSTTCAARSVWFVPHEADGLQFVTARAGAAPTGAAATTRTVTASARE